MRTRSLLICLALVAGAVVSLDGAARADIIVHVEPNWAKLCPPGACLPDLAVREEIRNGRQGFTVYNVGSFSAGAFRASVLRLGASYAIDLPGLAAGASEWFETDLGCSEAVTVIVNPFSTLPETSYNNNSVGYYGWCGL
jgi:hypothetical protein